MFFVFRIGLGYCLHWVCFNSPLGYYQFSTISPLGFFCFSLCGIIYFLIQGKLYYSKIYLLLFYVIKQFCCQLLICIVCFCGIIFLHLLFLVVALEFYPLNTLEFQCKKICLYILRQVEIREIVFKWCIVVEELLYFIYIW